MTSTSHEIHQDSLADLTAQKMAALPYGDSILNRLHRAGEDAARAKAEIRLIVAYARHFLGYRPYRLRNLADAAGLSVSGIRTSYSMDDVHLISGYADRDFTITPEHFLTLLDQLVAEQLTSNEPT
jgi:hypothetical protein